MFGWKNRKKNKSDKARTYRINAPRNGIIPKRNNLIGWLNNPDHSESEEMAAAQVRDIRETIEVIAVKKVGNGYGIFKEEKDISEHVGEMPVAKKLAKQTIRLPNYITMKEGVSKTIEKLEQYNLKYLPEWQSQPWLKGSLGIIFDSNGRFELNGIPLKYDFEFGLREEKTEDGKI